ncbi:uncharacterized protein LOC143274745 [Babylonia areolata]|uniref:uncharacterized protein LOC143274745 n=1 Tax=Babylonia areolata TaxID=304850 RepID=UPI003FD4EA48
MKCIIPGINLKVFGRAIHSLAKIGDELYFEPLEQGLSLRTVNSSRSAYACFLFFPSYFQHYDDGRKQTEASSSEDDDEGLRCKIIMKSVMAVFRSLSTIEKTVEKCKITHNAKEARLVFELYCRHGIVKKHNLAYIECETLQAIFSKELCPNKLTAPSKLLCEVVVSFQTTQEEVTLTARPDILSLKNYVEDEPDPNKVVHTELSLAPEEFDLYQVGVDTDITFCLKELRAILAFGETTGLPLNINFEAAGRPVTFCIDSDQTFEGNFVLATLAEELTSSQAPASQRGQQAPSQSHRRSAAAVAAAAGAKRGSGKSVASKGASTNGDVSAPRGNAEQGNVRNGPGPSAEEAAFLDDDDDNMGDISAEELAAAMEVEQEWEQAEAQRLQPPHTSHPEEIHRPPRDRDREGHAASSASSHTHGAKKDGLQEQRERAPSSSHTHGAKKDGLQEQRERAPSSSHTHGAKKDGLQEQRERAPSSSHTHGAKKDGLQEQRERAPSSSHTHGVKKDGRLPEERTHRSSSASSQSHKGEQDAPTHSGKRSRDEVSGHHRDRIKARSREGGKERPHHSDRETFLHGQEVERGGSSFQRSRVSPPERVGGERWGGSRLQRGEDDEEGEGTSASPVIPVQCPSADVTREGACLQPLSGDDDEDLDDTVPGTPPSTPPSKKFRSLFFGSSQKRSQPPHSSTVLAADTDEDD